MPSGKGATRGQAERITRSAAGTTAASRRALGDVSNTNKRRNASKEEKGENAAPRRSRRLTREPEEETTTTSASQQQTNIDGPSARDRRKNLRSTDQHLSDNPLGEPAPKANRKRKTDNATTASKRTSSARAKNANANNDTSAASDAKKLKRAPQPEAPASEPALEENSSTNKQVVAKTEAHANELEPQQRRRSDRVPHPVIPAAQSDDKMLVIQTSDFGIQRRNFRPHQFISGRAPYDKERHDDPQEVVDYLTDIYQRLYNSETMTRPEPYMENQKEINGMMRAILVDWLVEVHMKFRLVPGTLYLCVNIVDRYLNHVDVERRKLQLVGVTALLMACKYEEIYPPEVKDCVYITDRAYTRQDVIDMEAEICKTLKFNFSVATGHPFVQRYLQVLKADRIVSLLTNFYMERMLQEYQALEVRPSILAAAAVSLALNNPDYLELEDTPPPGIPQLLLDFTGFSTVQILDAADIIVERISFEPVPGRRPMDTVIRKYASSRNENVSQNFVLPKLAHLL